MVTPHAGVQSPQLILSLNGVGWAQDGRDARGGGATRNVVHNCARRGQVYNIPLEVCTME